MYTWGNSGDGQLGHSSYEKPLISLSEDSQWEKAPRRLGKSRRFKSAVVGDKFTMAISDESELYYWGMDLVQNKLKHNEPVMVELSGVKVKQMSAGAKHAGFVDESGLVYTWGQGAEWIRGGGKLGHGSVENISKPKLVQSFAEYGVKASMVSCGGAHTLILTEDGEVLSCGVGEYGLLGTGSTENSLVPLSLLSMIDQNVVQVAAGNCHSLLLTSEGKIFSFGRNHFGQLGHSDSFIDMYSMEEYPRLIEDSDLEGKFVTQIAAGNGRSAAITKDGLLYTWGSRLSIEPKIVDPSYFGNKAIKKVGCGGENNRAVTAVLTEDGELYTFGDASSMMLGFPDALVGKYPLPRRVPKFIGMKVVDFACGFGQHMISFVEL